jgi:hypothetical protein
VTRLSRSGWIVVGIVIGAIAIPALAVAAAVTVVNVRGNGNNAYVTPAHQLRSAPADPADFRFLTGGSSGSCNDLGAPAGSARAFVVTHADINVSSLNSIGAVVGILETEANCGGEALAVVTPATTGPHEFDLSPGVALPAGTHLSFDVINGGGTVTVTGYAIPTVALPAGVRTVRSAGGIRLPAPRR